MNYRDIYELWCEKVTDTELAAELAAMAGDEKAIEDAFYTELSFGTAGLRGIIGAGTNRMNIYTVAKATQGLADYLNKKYDAPTVAIAYDSRIKSDLFSQVASGVLAANGVGVHLWPQLMPVPALSYAVRALGVSAGIVVTASHNPSAYNGYKVYGDDGCQITTQASEEILAEITKLDMFEDINTCPFHEAVEDGKIKYISDDVYTDFIEEVKNRSVLFGEEVNKDIAIVYTPLNGAGLGPVTRVLKESGYTNITVVKEQEQPDGNFPTCPYPNPEIREAMELSIEYAGRYDADLLIATDPDCDRAGIAVKDSKGEYVLLSGNQTGALLLDYICLQRAKHDMLPEEPVFIKTIVTTELCQQIASSYGVATKNVLTGFKYIGEQIGELESQGRADSFVFGFEESYGYLSGAHVRDKDAVNAAFLICEMFCYYADRGISLLDRLDALYQKFGYCVNKVHSYGFEGASGFEKMKKIMDDFREVSGELGGRKIVSALDYSEGIDGLPKANVLQFYLEDNCSVIVRPSGTEPKIKVYITVSAETGEAAEAAEQELSNRIERFINISK